MHLWLCCFIGTSVLLCLQSVFTPSLSTSFPKDDTNELRTQLLDVYFNPCFNQSSVDPTRLTFLHTHTSTSAVFWMFDLWKPTSSYFTPPFVAQQQLPNSICRVWPVLKNVPLILFKCSKNISIYLYRVNPPVLKEISFSFLKGKLIKCSS